MLLNYKVSDMATVLMRVIRSHMQWLMRMVKCCLKFVTKSSTLANVLKTSETLDNNDSIYFDSLFTWRSYSIAQK